ncbi:MAG: hypothetical protein FJW69_00325 [Actinobacteria bacterium]|nr:hypothetical protein [Actinomycetota bacterium]MBM3713765.1 hypothetical protein [Actinomycetota bacterium]
MIDNKIDFDLIQNKIKNSGFKLTKSRRTILNIIKKAKKDLTADDIFVLSLKKDPGIGIATVYRTLALMEKFGIIEKIYRGSNKAVYSPAENMYSNKKPTLKKAINTVSENSGIKISKTEGLSPAYLGAEEGYYFKGKIDDYHNIEKINKIQAQLDIWTGELKKIKREREIELEEIINDFGKIDKILEKHELNKNNLIQMLIDFQTEYNWLPRHVLFYVGSKINVPLSQIYGIASFYKFFNLEPRGKYQIIVCAGTACHVRGSMNLLQRIVNVLKIKPGDTTADYKFTLDTVNCLGCCALGPVMLFNNKYYSNPSKKELEKLLGSVT